MTLINEILCGSIIILNSVVCILVAVVLLGIAKDLWSTRNIKG